MVPLNFGNREINTVIRLQDGETNLLAGIVLWHVVYQSQIGLSTGFLGSMSHMHMSRLWVPDTTIGVRLERSVVLRRVASGTIRFMKALVTTLVTSPI